MVDTSSKRVRKAYSDWWNTTSQKQKEVFNKSGVDYATINTDEDYVKPLINIFKKR